MTTLLQTLTNLTSTLTLSSSRLVTISLTASRHTTSSLTTSLITRVLSDENNKRFNNGRQREKPRMLPEPSPNSRHYRKMSGRSCSSCRRSQAGWKACLTVDKWNSTHDRLMASLLAHPVKCLLSEATYFLVMLGLLQSRCIAFVSFSYSSLLLINGNA